MITSKYKKLITTALCLLLPFSAALAQQSHGGNGERGSSSTRGARGEKTGNGGVGVVSPSGQLNTLYTAGGHAEPNLAPPPAAMDANTEAPSEIPPEIPEMEAFIEGLPYLHHNMKNYLIAAIHPTNLRKYFSNIYPSDLTSTMIGRLLAQYQRVTGVGTNKLKLYGITDTNSPIQYDPGNTRIVTYLLPAYYELRTANERKTALFHEAAWALSPKATLAEVVHAEKAFQAILEAPQDPGRAIDFVRSLYDLENKDRYYHRDTDALKLDENKLSAQFDIATGALRGFMDERGNILSNNFWGEDTLRCGDPRGPELHECYVVFRHHIAALRAQYPNSLFLLAMEREANNTYNNDGQFRISAFYDRFLGWDWLLPGFRQYIKTVYMPVFYEHGDLSGYINGTFAYSTQSTPKPNITLQVDMRPEMPLFIVPGVIFPPRPQ